MAIVKWEGESTVNTTLIRQQQHPAVATLPNGGYVVAWMDGSRSGTANDIRYQVFLADGTKVGAERVAFEGTSVTQPYTLPEIVVLSDGRFVISASGDRVDGTGVDSDIASRVFATDGAPMGAAVFESGTATLEQINPASARVGTGWVTVWDEQGTGGAGIVGKIYSSNGTPTVLQFSAAANASNKIGNDPDVAVLADGKIVVTWEANEAFHAQVFLPDGTALGSVFDFTKPAGVVNVDHMELAAGNNLVVTYRSEDKKIWKAEYSVDALGAFTAVAPHSMVDSTTAAGTDLYEQQVLALQKSGGYAIVYRGSQLTLGDTGDILIKVYDATGAEVQQSRFKVNTSAAVQGEPALAELADGRIIVTWHDFNSDSFIQQQILDTRTAPVNVVGTDGADYYVGTSVGGDTLVGGLGDDKLEGGAGADTLKGGTDTPNAGAEGTDTASYLHAKAGVTVNMLTSVNAGDAAGDVFSSIENVEGSNFGDSLTGDNGANYLWGRGGNDVLSGGAAADTLDGGAGNDTYLITDSADKVVETAGNGIDTVIASFSFDLGTLPNVENLQAASGTASISLSGSIVDNALYGNDGINVLSGLDGNDSLFAYAGNDVVMGGNGNDVMSGGDGVDQVTGGAGNDVAYGEIGNDMLNGEAGNDVVYGGVGDDVLKGELGIDTLYGDVGKDKLYGGAGKDVLYGGKGQDGFYFDATLNKSTNVDRIMDFNSKEDTLYLARKFFKGMKAGKIASKAFYAGTAAHDADDRFIYNKKAGVIYFDSDGLGGKAQIQFALVKKGISVSAADFHVL